MRNFVTSRYHDISCGHRVVGHEGKCQYLHGHNYRIHFFCESSYGELDKLGRVIDFGVIKERLCQWLEDNWDHRFLMWSNDPYLPVFVDIGLVTTGIIVVSFNPTAENMAEYLVQKVGPSALVGTGVRLVRVVIEETRKCSASYGVER